MTFLRANTVACMGWVAQKQSRDKDFVDDYQRQPLCTSRHPHQQQQPTTTTATTITTSFHQQLFYFSIHQKSKRNQSRHYFSREGGALNVILSYDLSLDKGNGQRDGVAMLVDRTLSALNWVVFIQGFSHLWWG